MTRSDDGTGNEIETFDSTVEGQVDVGGGPVPVTLTGPVTIVTLGKVGNTTGTFDTEIVALSLSGDAGGVSVEIRESPELALTGRDHDHGRGRWPVSDRQLLRRVCTELSIDGGAFQPQTNGPGRMELRPDPAGYL